MVNHHWQQVLLVLSTNWKTQDAFRTHWIVKKRTRAGDRDETTLVSRSTWTRTFFLYGLRYVSRQEATGETKKQGYGCPWCVKLKFNSEAADGRGRRWVRDEIRDSLRLAIGAHAFQTIRLMKQRGRCGKVFPRSTSLIFLPTGFPSRSVYSNC